MASTASSTDAHGGRHRRADRRRPAAGDGRGALHPGAARPASTSSGWRRRPPTTSACPRCSQNTSGFVYYVSMTGITGSALRRHRQGRRGGRRIKGHTDLPVCVGFGVKTAEQARAIGASADGVVVGTAIVNAVANVLDPKGGMTADPAEAVATLVSGLAQGVRSARLARCRIVSPSLLSRRRDRRHELDHQLRPPEDQLDARPPRHAGKSLDQGSRERRDGVPQGSGEQPVRHPVLRPPHEDLGQASG